MWLDLHTRAKPFKKQEISHPTAIQGAVHCMTTPSSWQPIDISTRRHKNFDKLLSSYCQSKKDWCVCLTNTVGIKVLCLDKSTKHPLVAPL
jgi:hypothetical protein